MTETVISNWGRCLPYSDVCLESCQQDFTSFKVLTGLTFKTRVIPCCKSMSWASRETVFSTNKMFGRKETTLATKFFRNSNSWRTRGSREARRFSLRCVQKEKWDNVLRKGERTTKRNTLSMGKLWQDVNLSILFNVQHTFLKNWTRLTLCMSLASTEKNIIPKRKRLFT